MPRDAATHDQPAAIYARADIVRRYADEDELQPAERMVLDEYVAGGTRVLDVGVGAGRTTRALLPAAARYTAVDLSEPMLRATRSRTGAAVVRADAVTLPFPSRSFDTIVFSFNGIDCIPAPADRERSLRELRRCVTDEGVVILSTHNSSYVLYVPELRGLGLPRAAKRTAYAAYVSASNLGQRLATGTLFRGAGRISDVGEPGRPRFQVRSRRIATLEFAAAGFEVAACVAAPDPTVRTASRVPWYYYVLRPSPRR